MRDALSSPTPLPSYSRREIVLRRLDQVERQQRDCRAQGFRPGSRGLGSSMVKDKQVQLLRLKMAEGKTIEAAAAAADMSVRSAHNWKTGPLPSQTKKHRHWRTRQDPFEGVWEADVVPLLERDEAGALEVTTILAELGRRYGDRFDERHLRTLQRRVRDWRTLHGPGK